MGKTNKKTETDYKKPKHGKLGAKASKREFNNDEQLDIADATNVFAFEKYCGSCDNFDTDACPFYGEVNEGTDWELEKHCDSFWD